MKVELLVLGGVIGSLFCAGPSDARIFTDATGRTVEAELVGVRGENVVLSRNGRAAQWPIAKLSDDDQAYVAEWRKNPPSVSRVTVRIWERDGMSGEGTLDEGEELGPPKNIPLLKTTEETAKYKHYDIDLTNESEQDASNLTVAYVMYVISPEGNLGTQSGSKRLDGIVSGKRETVQSESVTYTRSKTTTMTFNVNRIEGLTTGSDASRSKERFGGAWVRVYETDGTVVGEAKQMHPEIERLQPKWTGPTVGKGTGSGVLPASFEGMELPLPASFEALEKLLGVLDEIKENLPRPPAAPPGFPGPSGR